MLIFPAEKIDIENIMQKDDLTLVILGILIIILFIIMSKFLVSIFKNADYEKTPLKNATKKPVKKCPICDSDLYEGEKVDSVLFNDGKQKDCRCYIKGCPHCYPHCEKLTIRMCPVCRKKIPEDGYLIARYFIKPDSKNHVHVLGCTECCKKK